MSFTMRHRAFISFVIWSLGCAGVHARLDTTEQRQVAQKPMAAPTMSVCEVFSNLDRFSGRMVQIRGTMNSGYHGAVLATENCGTKRGLHRWFEGGAAISLTVPADEWSLPENVIAEFARLGEAKVSPTVTVVGKIVVRKHYRPQLTKDGDLIGGNGFGFLGRYPAELIIKELKDIRENPGTGRAESIVGLPQGTAHR